MGTTAHRRWRPLVALTVALAMVPLTACGGSGPARAGADAGTDAGDAGADERSADPGADALGVCRPGAAACTVSAGGRTLTVTGTPAEPVRVTPPAGHPLATIDRDAGVAARLRDGSVLWLFGDTAARDDGGALTYFRIGTGAWAPADAPTETHDAVDAAGEPIALSTRDDTCPRPGQRAGTWPAAAVVEPVGPRDRVLVWMENVCLGSGPTLDDRGMSVAEWWYDPADPPDGRPVVATIVNGRLFDQRSHGSAVVRAPGPDGAPGDDLVTFRCHSTTDGGRPDDYGPCWVARTTVADAADPTTYREWDGTGFDAPVGAGTPLDLPAGPHTAPHPPAGFSVTHDAATDAWVMAYSPWPGPSSFLDLRVAPAPEGPWSEPVTVRLPDCDDRLGERRFPCYAGGVQPSFSTPGRLGLGWYDTQVSAFPTRGSYVVSSVAVTLSR